MHALKARRDPDEWENSYVDARARRL